MENETILNGLVKRRAELLGDLKTGQERVQEMHHDLASLDAVIRQFDPNFPVGNIRAKYRKQPTTAEYGAMSRAVLNALRSAGKPLSAMEIADVIMHERGMALTDRAARRNMVKRAGMALRYQRTNGIVSEVESEGVEARWAVVG